MTKPRMSRFRRSLILVILFALCIGLNPVFAYYEAGSFEYNRARLLAYTLNQYLSMHHFSHKSIDDDLSKTAFSIYLKQLDSQKLFLLKRDVEKLRTYADKMDDELTSGQMTLPDLGWKILSRRTEVVQKIVKEILAEDFNFTVDEQFETDPEKLQYCVTMDELRERWRKNLKLQVLSQYLNLMDEKAGTEDAKKDAGEQKDIDPGTLQAEARKRILKNYELSFSKVSQEKDREHFDRYFAAIARAFDPHTEYMPPMNKEDFDIGMRGSLEGIGATLREDDGYIKVVSIVPGGPASLQGQLQAEDLILKVAEGKKDPVDLMYMKVSDAVRLIRGKKGTEVRLTVKKPDGSRLVIPIVRDIVQLEDTFAKGTVLEDADGKRKYGYIKIPSFYRDFEKTRHGGNGRNVTDDVKKELDNFDSGDISGVILDLRNNGGGALTDAVQIAGLFIKTGPVVQIKSASGKISVLSDDDPDVVYSGPLVILVNQFSASASEILAGALQDYGRAVVIGGEHTHGKGTVQSIFDLNETIPLENMDKYKPLGALRLTIQKFYRITGESTQYRGIIPDIVLPDRLNGMKTGEQYLEHALPWDTISAASFARWPEFRTDIGELREKSSKRISANKDFKEIEKRIKSGSAEQKNTLQSLHIDVARKDRAEARARRETEGMGPGHGHGGHRPPGPALSGEDKRDWWLKEVRADIYIQEAASVLNNMLAHSRNISRN